MTTLRYCKKCGGLTDHDRRNVCQKCNEFKFAHFMTVISFFCIILIIYVFIYER